MNDSKSEQVKRFLAEPDVHQKWIGTYYCAENETFYEQAFDYIISILKAPKNSTFLDAGCGNCAHSIRLANRVFSVQAVDFSESVLKMAEANVKTKKLEDKIKIQREDITALSFEDKSFNYILCWGVLMHIPNIEKAISELTRVLKPGGTLVIAENNMYSLYSITIRNLKRLLGKGKGVAKKVPSGVEHWSTTPTGTLVTRHANIQWLLKRFKSNQFVVKKRIAGQFTQLYTRVSSRPLKSLIHGFNNLWFRYIKNPHLAFGNIVILQKMRDEATDIL